MTKTELKAALEVATDRELAEFYGVTPQAVSAWGETVPDGRLWEARAKRPDLWQPDPANDGEGGTNPHQPKESACER